MGVLGSIAFSVVKDDLFGISQTDIPSWVRLEDEDKIGKRRAKEAVLAAVEWDNRFHCERSIVINSLDNPFTKPLPDGRVIRQEEFATPGKISIAAAVSARDNVLHAMTHACQQLDQPKPINPPIPITEGAIVGIQGLTVIVKLNTVGEEHSFPWFEEGMAERNASAFKGYSVNNPTYFALGSLTLRKFPLESSSNAHNFAKTSDIDSFIRGALNLSPSVSIGSSQFEQVMNQYQSAYNEEAEKTLIP